MWKKVRDENYEEAKANALIKGRICVGADGRYDSPGHNAKYCTYVIQDLLTNRILETETIVVRSVMLRFSNDADL